MKGKSFLEYRNRNFVWFWFLFFFVLIDWLEFFLFKVASASSIAAHSANLLANLQVLIFRNLTIPVSVASCTLLRLLFHLQRYPAEQYHHLGSSNWPSPVSTYPKLQRKFIINILVIFRGGGKNKKKVCLCPSSRIRKVSGAFATLGAELPALVQIYRIRH